MSPDPENKEPTVTPSYYKSPHEIALLLTLRPARKEQGKRVHAAVLARLEIAMAIEEALASK